MHSGLAEFMGEAVKIYVAGNQKQREVGPPGLPSGMKVRKNEGARNGSSLHRGWGLGPDSPHGIRVLLPAITDL